MFRFRFVFAFFVALLLFGGLQQLAHAADGEFATIYVPKKGATLEVAPVELVFPSQEGPVLPRALMWVLQQQLQEYLQPMTHRYAQVHEEKCIVQMRQVVATFEENLPYFRGECWASPLVQGQNGTEQRAAFEKPEEMLGFLIEFSKDRAGAKRFQQKQLWHKQVARPLGLI